MRKCEDLVFQKTEVSEEITRKPKGIFSLKKCKNCNKLYTIEQYKWMNCDNAVPNISVHGQIISKHEEDLDFKLNLFVQFMRKLGLTW